MSRVFSDPDADDGDQPELGFPAARREAEEHGGSRTPVDPPRREEGRPERRGEPAHREFFRAKRRPVLPFVGLFGAVATVAFFVWLGRDDAAPPSPPAADELAPVAAAPDFEVPFPEAGGVAPSPDSLAAAPEPDPSIAPSAPTPTERPAPEPPAAAPLAALPAPAAAAKPPAAPVSARGAYAVQLLAGRSEADVGASWKKLRSAHPDLLASLSPTVARTDRAPGETFYRLRAGPLPDRAAADALCRALSARQQACFVVSPGS